MAKRKKPFDTTGYISPYAMEQNLANSSKKTRRARNNATAFPQQYNTTSNPGRAGSVTGGSGSSSQQGTTRSPSYYTAPSIFDITTEYGRQQKAAYEDLVGTLHNDRTASYTLGKFIDDRFSNLNNELFAEQNAQRDSIRQQIDINKLAAKQGNWDFIKNNPIDFTSLGISEQEAEQKKTQYLQQQVDQIKSGANPQLANILNNKYIQYFGDIRGKTQYQENTLAGMKRDYESYLAGLQGNKATPVGNNPYQKMLDSQGIKIGTSGKALAATAVTPGQNGKPSKSKITALQISQEGDRLKDLARNAALKLQQEKNFKGSWSKDDLKAAANDVLAYKSFVDGKGSWDKDGKYSAELPKEPEQHNVIQRFWGGVADLLPKGAEDFVTDNLINSGFGDALTNPIVQPLQTAIEELSRPLSAVNAAQIANNESLTKSKDPIKSRTFVGKDGKIYESIPLTRTGELPEGITAGERLDAFKTALNAGWDTFIHNDFTPGDKVIESQRALYGLKASKADKIIGGLFNDLSVDPLNFIGVGVASTPIKTINEVKTTKSLLTDLSKVGQLSDETTAIIRRDAQTRGLVPDTTTLDKYEVDSDEMFNLLTGGLTRTRNKRGKVVYSGVPKTEAERVTMLQSSKDAASELARRLDQIPVQSREASEWRRVADFRDQLGKDLTQKRVAALDSFEMDSLLDSISENSNLFVKKGIITPEDAVSIQNSATLDTIAQNWREAVTHETYLDNVASKLNLPKGPHIDEAGAGYTKAFDDLDSALERGEIDLNTYNRSFREAEKAQSDFESRLDAARTSVGDTQSRSINEILGPSWAKDPRFDPQTTQKLFREASQIAANASHIKDIDHVSQRLAKQINDLNPGSRQDQLIRQKSKVDAQAFRERAQIFIDLANKHILSQSGQVAIKNTPRTQEIRGALDVIAERRMQPAVSNVGLDAAPEGTVRPTGDEILDRFKNDPESAFAPDAQFYDSHDQLDHMTRSLNRMLMKEEGIPPTLDNLGKRMPESFQTVDQTTGEITADIDKIMSHIKTDETYGNVMVVNKTSDEATNEWLSDLADHFYVTAEKENRRLIKNARRRNVEIKSKEWEKTHPRPVDRTGKVPSSDEFAVGNLRGMFTVKTNSDGTERLTTPVFHAEDGTELAVGSNAAKKYVKDNGLVTRGDFKQHQTTLKLFQDLEDADGSLGALRDRVRHFVDKLVDTGKSGVPKGDMADKVAYLRHNEAALLIDFDPETIATRRLFENEHGMTIREANELKNRIDDSANTISLKGTEFETSAWAKKFPEGVTKDQVRNAANGSLNDFKRMFGYPGAPFSLNPLGISAKEARSAGNNMNKWAERNWQALKKLSPDKRNKMIDDVWTGSKRAQARGNAQAETDLWKQAKNRFLASKEGDTRLPSDSFAKFHKESLATARSQIEEGLRSGSLETGPMPNTKVLPRTPVGYNSNLADVEKAIRTHFDSKKSTMLIQRHLAKVQRNADEIKRLDAAISDNQNAKDAFMAAHDQRLMQAREARQVLKRRLLEDAILTTAKISSQSPTKRIGISLFGKMVPVPGSEFLFKTAEQAAGLPLMSQATDAWRTAFKSPASQLSEEGQRIAARYNAVTPNIVERGVLDLQSGLGQFPEKLRRADFGVFYRTGKFDNPDFEKALDRGFGDMITRGDLPGLYSNQRAVGDSVLSLADINRHMPEGWGLSLSRNSPKTDTIHGLYRNVFQGSMNKLKYKAANEGWSKKQLRTAKTKLANELSDPYHVAWNLRVAGETAYARKALEYQINTVFGVRRDMSAVTERLHKDVGWEAIEDLGNTHYFPPEVVPEIKRLLDMTRPDHISRAGKTIDDITRVWKTMTTVYNPGFWTRNGLGEIMSSWIAGVHSSVPYRHAASVVRYARKDGAELDALKSQFPLMEHLKSDSVSGQRTLFTMKNGRKVSVEDVWVAYFDQGLKTGFFNTEFNREISKTGDKIRGNEIGKLGANAHQSMRLASEGFEDWLRMGHFIDTLMKSPAKDLKTAAEQASRDVRKYHFDYADFTKTEKAVMLRAFPFYKWTRKAMPLFAEMLFLKPGKIMAYPKVMSALEQNSQNSGISTDDIAGGRTSFAPNYTGIVPDFIQDMWAYKIRSYGDEAERETFMNVNVPQMDALKSINNPGGTAHALLTPFLKVPLDRATGEASEFGANPLDQILNSLPQTNFANKLAKNGGETPEEDIWRFITGVGLYQNNENQRFAQGYRDR